MSCHGMACQWHLNANSTKMAKIAVSNNQLSGCFETYFCVS